MEEETDTDKVEAEKVQTTVTANTSGAPETKAPANVKTLSASEYADMQNKLSRLNELEAAERTRKEEADAAEEERLRKEGEYKTLLAKKDEKVKAAETKSRADEAKYRTALRDRELNAALAQHTLVKGGAAQVAKLIRDELETVDNGEEYDVRSRDGKACAEYVAEVLATEEYAKFVAGRTTGGAPETKANRTPPKVEKVDAETDQRQRQKNSLRERAKVVSFNPLSGRHLANHGDN